jgi:hypothetical protein
MGLGFRTQLLGVLLGVGALVAACGEAAFVGVDDEGSSGAASAGEGAGAEASGGSSGAGSSHEAGAPSSGGAESEAGAASGGAPATPPSIVIVQKTRTGIVGNADPSLTLPTVPATGNALIVGITCFSDFENCVIPESGVTDNQGNHYRLVIEGASIVSSDTHGSRPYLFIAESIAAPSGPLTITVNPNGTPPDNYQNFAWGVLEVSGLARENSVDQTGSVPNSCCEPSTTVSTDAATVQANELAVAVHSARSNDNDFNYAHDPVWVEQHLNDDGVSLASQHSLVTRVLTETGVISHTWTHDEPTRGVAAVIATFRGVAP